MRAAWFCAGAGAICLLQSGFHPDFGWPLAAATAGLAVIAAIAPFTGLLVFAGLSPLWAMVTVLSQTKLYGPGVDQVPALALIAGWACRRAFSSRRMAIPAGALWSTTILISLAVSSAIVSAAISVAEHPGTPPAQQLWTMIAREYFVGSNALTHSLLFIEGLVLLLVAADSCAGDENRRRQAMRLMVVAAAAAALLNLVRILQLPIQHQQPWSALGGYLVAMRVNVHYADLNAAGSYFAMMLFISLAVAARTRFVVYGATLLIAAGLWLAGSRIALAATLLTGALGAVLTLRRSGRWLVPAAAGLALIVLAVMAAWRWYPESRNANPDHALAFRVETGRAALMVAADHPWFGAGLGRLHPLSQQYARMPENAHNNFLQVFAELGVIGLLTFLVTLALPLREAWRQQRGLLAGLSAYLLSCMGGHPLLVAGAAFPFWIALGLAAGPPSEDRGPAVPSWYRTAGLLLAIVIMLTVPLRTIAALRDANLEHASVGLSGWHREPDGSRYRWAGGRAKFFVASSARAVAVPLRPGPDAPPALEVRIFLEGREVNRILLRAGDNWRTVRLLIVSRGHAAFVPVGLELRLPGSSEALDSVAGKAGGVLMVGRPVIER